MSNEKYVKRFSKFIIVAHWTNAICFFMLLFTGLPLYLGTSFNFIANIFGGPENAQIIHRVFAIIFLIPTPFMILMDGNGFRQWTSTVTKWGKRDIQYFAAFPLEMIGKANNMPKQDFFNGGQKLNSLLTICGATIMVCSGMIMWFKEYFPTALVQWMYPLHDTGMAVMVAVIIGHIYLSVGHPASRPAFMGMTKGVVPESYAKAHHGKWYDELKERNEV